ILGPSTRHLACTLASFYTNIQIAVRFWVIHPLPSSRILTALPPQPSGASDSRRDNCASDYPTVVIGLKEILAYHTNLGVTAHTCRPRTLK
ncbi:hypothetical protein CH063_15546, partial [Colletotrichum higginsianum]